ncbi:MAG: hypothetical protein JO072_03010 [Parafilimonas sp.]|nr:hypothetical protein [Parafilimonas sp.]
MFISDKLIYLALHKTGCTHVLKLLTSTPELNGKIIGKHNTIYDVTKQDLGDLNSKIKAGNIRNPWDWYVSLWAFGSMGKGGLYDQIVKKSFYRKLNYPVSFFTPVEEWKHAYSNAEDPQLFKKWLKLLLVSRRKDLIGYGQGRAGSIMGLLTYRYLGLYSYNFKKQRKVISSYQEVFEFDKQNNFLDFYIRNENLESDFSLLMNKLGIETGFAQQISNIPKTNSSVRKNYKEYYDQELMELVNEKERLIIEKHNYKF